jgi:hypothetical protein
MDDAQTQILGPDQKTIVHGQHQNILVITRHILLRQLGSPGKKDADTTFFCTISNQGFFFFFFLSKFCQKVTQKKKCQQPPQMKFF